MFVALVSLGLLLLSSDTSRVDGYTRFKSAALLDSGTFTLQLHDKRHIFRIELLRNDEILVDNTAVEPITTVHTGGATEKLHVDADPYIVTGIAAYDAIRNVNAPLVKTEVKDPFGSFLIRTQPQLTVKGGFWFRGGFRKVDWPSGQTPMPLQVSSRARCGHDDLRFNTDVHGATASFAKSLASIRRAPKGCPAERKMLHVAVVADCSYVRHFRGNKIKAQENIIADFGLVSGIYERTFNISIGIVSITLMAECSSQKDPLLAWNGPCDKQPSIEKRLSMFSLWRASQPANAGVYHMVSGCSGSEVVGIAWLNQVCQAGVFTSNGMNVSGTSVTVVVPNQFSTIAHELAHNLGAIHDCTASDCAKCKNALSCPCCSCGPKCDCQGRFLMNPQSGGVDLQLFSPCTRDDVCAKLPVLATCLKGTDVWRRILVAPGSTKIVTSTSVCGNGIREPGEECDCGSNCENDPCCDIGCKLRPGAVCSDANDGCCKNCRVIPAEGQHVCRKKQGICQKDSICDGKSFECRDTVYVPDGMSCSEEGFVGQCASGQCTSRDAQCDAIGRRVGLRTACPSAQNSCKLLCQGSDGLCYSLDATFIDGTACGEAGQCYQGQCSESEAMGMVRRNSTVLIVIACVILGSILLYLSFAIFERCRQSHPR